MRLIHVNHIRTFRPRMPWPQTPQTAICIFRHAEMTRLVALNDARQSVKRTEVQTLHRECLS
jgi:hypothetical protein